MLTKQSFSKLARNFSFSSKMSSAALERIIANNIIASKSLESLKRQVNKDSSNVVLNMKINQSFMQFFQFSCLQDEHINRKINEIHKENEVLSQHVEDAKQQLTKLEIANGKRQIEIPVPKQADKSQSAFVQPTSATTKTEEKPQQQKKEKVKKEKTPSAEKTPSNVEIIDVSRLDMRVGKIVEVSKHPDADALYLEKIDVGEAAPRTVVSGLVRFVPIEEMQNRMVIVLCNLKPAKMRGVTSEAMVMCASTPEKVEIMSPPAGSVPGDLVTCVGFARNPDPIMNPKKKIFETVAPDLMVNGDLVGTYKGAALVVEEKGSIKSQSLKNVNIK